MEWVIEIGKQVPALVVLAFIVINFMKYLEKRDQRFSDTLTNINQQCHDHQKDVQNKMALALKENSESLRDHQQMMGQVKHALDRIKI